MRHAFSYEDLGCTRESFERLLSLHTPAFFLDKKERYWPASVEWFLQHAALVERGQDGLITTILPRGSVSQEQLLAVAHECTERGEKKRLALWLDEEDVCGPDPSRMNEDVPVYAFAKAVCDLQGVPESLEINYMALFTFNGAYPLWGLPCLLAGDHQGDWEHITIRLRLPDFLLTGVWYNSHRNIEGEWAAAKDVLRDSTGRIISFVARNGHGHYPRAGVVFRIFCAANDLTSAHGRVWRPCKVVRLCGVESGHRIPACTTRGCTLPPLSTSPANTPSFFQQPHEGGFPEVVEDASVWQRWNGSWGTSDNPPRQCWFTNPEPPVSRTAFQRLCCPLARGVDTLLPQGQLRQAQECKVAEQAPHRLGGKGTLVRHVSKDASTREQPYDTLVIARPLPGDEHTNPVSEAPEVKEMSRA